MRLPHICGMILSHNGYLCIGGLEYIKRAIIFLFRFLVVFWFFSLCACKIEENLQIDERDKHFCEHRMKS